MCPTDHRTSVTTGRILAKYYRLYNNNNTRLAALFWDYPGKPVPKKPIWILLKQETVSGNGISWAICPYQVCTSLLTDNHASTPPLKVFYRPDALPTAQPTASKH